MAVIIASGHGLQADSRWKQWGKIVRSVADIDLNASDGYALKGPFVDWGKAVALEPGQFLVLASEQGSRSSRKYHYVVVDHTDAVIEAVGPINSLPDVVQAKAHNSELYRIGAMLWLWYRDFAASRGRAVEEESAALDAAWAAVCKLEDADRQEVMRRLDAVYSVKQEVGSGHGA